MGNKKQHEWGFMANDKSDKFRGDLFFCPLCKQWSWMGEKPFFRMAWEKYELMHKEGEIDASELLGQNYPIIELTKKRI